MRHARGRPILTRHDADPAGRRELHAHPSRRNVNRPSNSTTSHGHHPNTQVATILAEAGIVELPDERAAAGDGEGEAHDAVARVLFPLMLRIEPQRGGGAGRRGGGAAPAFEKLLADLTEGDGDDEDGDEGEGIWSRHAPWASPDGPLLAHVRFECDNQLLVLNPRASAARELLPRMTPVERVWHIPPVQLFPKA